MFFKKTTCPNCQCYHDEMLDFCPMCGVRNEAHQDFKRGHLMTFIPWYLELTLALIGLFGFTVINIAFSLIFYRTYEADPVRGLMLINVASYIVFFIACVAIMFRYFRGFFEKFKYPKAYLFGLLGFAALIGFSYMYNIFIYIIRPGTGEGGNQSAVSEMVTNFPIISIIVVGIIGPICEELAYRVGLFSLLRRIHPAVAYVGTAFIFGMIHFDFSNTDIVTELIYLVDYMFAGLCFSFIYCKKGIAASTTAHILNNLLSIILIAYFPNV